MTAKDCDCKRKKNDKINHLGCVVNGKISDLKENKKRYRYHKNLNNAFDNYKE